MKTKLLLCLSVLAIVDTTLAQGTAFTYQGRLNDGPSPAKGSYDLQFSIYDSTNNPGVLIAGPLTNSATSVSNGLFNVMLDFGSVFDGSERWLEIAVRTNGGAAFTTLLPRQQITPAPYAIMANSASNLLGTLSAGQLSGTIPSAAFSGSYTNPLTFNNGLDAFSGTFSGQFFGPLFVGGSFSGAHFGDGSGLYNLNASQLSGGTVPASALGNAWKISGNTGTTAGVNFLGTSDNQPLELRANNQRVLQLLPDNSTNNAPDIVGGSLSNAVTAGLVGTTISGGAMNTVGPTAAVSSNNPYGDFGAYPMGASFSTIGGGYLNQIQAGATFSTIGGGATNTISAGDVESTIAGGFGNSIVSNASWSAIGGGTHHTIGSGNGFIGGGWRNVIQTNSSYSTIGGGLFNTIQGDSTGAVIGGGDDNTIGPDGVSGGGGGFYSVIGGGYFNRVFETTSFIGGGQQNLILGLADHSTIGGGYSNVISGSTGPVYGFIGGGQINVVQGNSAYAVIAGGNGNTIQSNSSAAVVSGGSGNIAGGTNSFAAGSFAQATNNGAFVWSDTSGGLFNSTSNNQFLIRAAGGVGIGTNSPAGALHVVAGGSGTNIALRVDNGGIAVSGAGIGTGTAAFIQLTSATNIAADATRIDNPLCNGDPNALLFVTHNWNPPNGTTFTYFNKSYGVYYSGGHWLIFAEDGSIMPTNIAFNVLVVKR